MKRNLKKISRQALYLLLALYLFFLNCCYQKSRETRLPKEMPANTSFLFEQKSFTSGSVYQISIKNGVIFYNESITGFNKSWEEKISPEQTKELYQLFLDNKFDLMKFTPSENHSVSEAYIIIRLVIDSKTIVEIKNTGIEIASAEDKAGFNQIAAKMQKLAKSSN